MEATNLDDIYGTPLLDWELVAGRLDQGVSHVPRPAVPASHLGWRRSTDGSPVPA
jgi:hypothetical protein